MFNESYGKARCRKEVWEAIHNTRKLYVGQHLVLAGAFAGDVPVLLQHNVPEKNVVIVDVVPQYVKRARARWPKACAHEGDVLDAAFSKFHHGLDSMYLDWCGTVNEASIIRSVITACEGLKLGGSLACTFFASREKDTRFIPETMTGRSFRKRAKFLGDHLFAASAAYTNSERFLIPKEFVYYRNEAGHPMLTYIGQLVADSRRSEQPITCISLEEV